MSLSERMVCEPAPWVCDDVQNLEATNAELCEEVQNFEAMKAELLEALEKALLMCDKMTDGNGPYKYIDGTQLVSDAYDTSNLLKQAIAKAKGEGV